VGQATMMLADLTPSRAGSLSQVYAVFRRSVLTQ
jgi:hypothetical protein